MKRYRLFLAAVATALFLATQAMAASVAGLPVFTELAEHSGPAGQHQIGRAHV